MRIVKNLAAVCAAVALAAPAFAEPVDEPVAARSYGWTPVAIGLATPVQLPWGIDKWDVFGLDFNLAYADAPKMYGLELALADTARKDMIGLQASGVFNYAGAGMYGMQFSTVNLGNGESYGVSAGAFDANRLYHGLEVDIIGNMTRKDLVGCSVAGLGSAVDRELWGAQIAIGANFAREAHGLQAAVGYNQTDMLNGAQVGLVNLAFKCEGGFQIGLVNIIMDNWVPFLPFVNGYF